MSDEVQVYEGEGTDPDAPKESGRVNAHVYMSDGGQYTECEISLNTYWKLKKIFETADTNLGQEVLDIVLYTPHANYHAWGVYMTGKASQEDEPVIVELHVDDYNENGI